MILPGRWSRWALLLPAAALAACDGSSPSAPSSVPSAPSMPNIRGTYSSAQMYATTAAFVGGPSDSMTCGGSFTISSQSGGSWSGSFIEQSGGRCVAMSGTVSGTVRTDGGISFSMDNGSSGDPLVAMGCRRTFDSGWSGQVSGATLSANRNTTYDCSGAGEGILTGTKKITGTRQ
jgi:hypothetical protein